jgi:hypothetical protein
MSRQQAPTNAEGPRYMSMSRLGRVFLGLPIYRLKGEAGATMLVVNVKDLGHEADPSWVLTSVPVPDVGRVRRFQVLAGDVVVTARGTSLRTALVPERWSGAVLTSNLIAIRLGPHLRPELLQVYLESPAGRQAINRRLAGSALLSVTPSSVEQVEVPVPPIAKQEALAELVRIAQQHYEAAVAAAEGRRAVAKQIVLDSLRQVASLSGQGDQE